MKTVSEAYKTAMKEPLRNRGYMRVIVGNFSDNEMNGWMNVYANGAIYYSNEDIMFKKVLDYKYYATFENNFTKVDGSMYFPPRVEDEVEYLDTGLTCKEMGNYIEFRVSGSDTMHGVTFDFGEIYPTAFTITIGSYSTTVSNNTKSVYSLYGTFAHGIITIHATAMSVPNTRLRLFSVSLGDGRVYTNDDIQSSSLEYVGDLYKQTHIETTFNLTLLNKDHIDPEDPNFSDHVFRTENPMKVYYGIETANNSISWVNRSLVYIKDYQVDYDTISINAVDFIQLKGDVVFMDDRNSAYIYQTSYIYNIMKDVFKQMGTDGTFERSSGLFNVEITNPIPSMTCKEIIQMLTNIGNAYYVDSLNGNYHVYFKANSNDLSDNSFVIEKDDVFGHPVYTKNTLVKEIKMVYWEYVHPQLNTNSVDILNEPNRYYDVGTYTFVFENAPWWFVISYGTDGLTFTNSPYGAVVHITTAGYYQFRFTGEKADVVKHTVTIPVNSTGETITWENPLIGTKEMATTVGNYMKEIYKRPVTYDYDYRGYPEIEICDVLKQENSYIQNMKVKVLRQEINFDGALSGHLTTQKVTL